MYIRLGCLLVIVEVYTPDPISCYNSITTSILQFQQLGTRRILDVFSGCLKLGKIR